MLQAPSQFLGGEARPSKAPAAALDGFVRSTALSQVILATLAVTTYHVQIITRISSGYPLWYFWLASLLGDSKTSQFGSKIVFFMVMYATIQGALFASFLPPA